VLTRCEVDEASLLGRRGNGMAIFNHSMEWERACIVSSSIGTMERHVETAVRYANERHQFGQPIGKFQAVSHRIVDMKVRLEAARLILYRTGWLMQEGLATPMDSALANLCVSEACVQSGLDSVQVRGGYGYMAEYGVERDLRDSVAGRIYSGTSDIQKNLIARALGL
jgi:alkylation response protein AidB-like acyl-CoA dehydrogenase